VKTYLDLLRIQGVLRIVLSQLTAHFPFGMLSIAFLIHVERVHHSYAAAGAVLAALSIGQAIVGPLTSRWMGNVGMRPILLWTTFVCTATIVAMALLPLSVEALVALGFVAGCSMPPIQPAVRTIYPKMVSASHLTPLFSLDSALQEVIWIVGPVLATFAAAALGSESGILIAAAFFLVGGLWFISSPEVGLVRIPRSKTRFGGVLKRPAVIISTLVGLLLVSSYATVEAAIVAIYGEGGTEAGVMIAIYALGSLLGGLAWGHRGIGPWSLTIRLIVFTAGIALALISTEFWWVAIALFISGIGVAPALTVLFAMVSARVKFSQTAEAFAWIGSGELIGAGMGSALAGLSIDTWAAPAALWLAAILAIAATLGAVIARPWTPDLRVGTLGPLPDTEPVQLIS
jgi:MFS family permease